MLPSIASASKRGLRRIEPAETELARAQCETIRLKLLKNVAQVSVSVRRVELALSQAFSLKELFVHEIATAREAPQPRCGLGAASR